MISPIRRLESTARRNRKVWTTMKIDVRRDICLYWLLLSAQSAGAVVILWNAVAIYRRFLRGSTEPEPNVLAWAILAALLIQVAYWSAMRIFPSLRVGKQVVVGHVVLFLARLNFVFVGAFSSVGLFFSLSPSYSSRSGVDRCFWQCFSRCSVTRSSWSVWDAA